MTGSNFQWLNGLPAGAVWLAALSLLGLLVRQWVPLRKLQADTDASLRTDLMAEVKMLREELREERRDCERRLKALEEESDGRIKALEEQVAGLNRMIIQSSQSAAVLMGNPAGFATSKAARRSRGEDPQ